MSEITVECPNCGHRNQVDALKLRQAKCEACHESFIQEDVLPADLSDEEIASSVESLPAERQEEEVDTDSWSAKIGDHEEQVKYVNKGFWSKMRKYAGKVPFAHEAVAMYYCAMDPNTPAKVKVTAISALAYWILPIDLVPDIFPVIGYGDDATAIFVAYKAISSHITDEHRDKAATFFKK
ncbi:DUF1232 domain-containing protein [Paenibacillus sp. BK720]|uniref:DUF1232 domain-containing protein n=1 Tax=Paenibacillus sp. BK720 TaxID=2587092 RepID=UPI001FBA9860|nr:DUF1232 domain-containing protein [Paenibacillus sp. BK720]NIK70043.1 uncharacterized membrane protein YkvA (DUF1232 family) [Paenibacillus sp. BK720]